MLHLLEYERNPLCRIIRESLTDLYIETNDANCTCVADTLLDVGLNRINRSLYSFSS